VDRERRLEDRPIRLVQRQYAEGGRVDEVSRNVAEASDGGVVDDRVSVVEMKTVLKMIRVRDDEQREETESGEQNTRTGHFVGGRYDTTERCSIAASAYPRENSAARSGSRCGRSLR